MNIKHFNQGYDCDVFTFVPDIDITTEESQYKMVQFHDLLQRCYLCERTWFSEQPFWREWYPDFISWVRKGSCSFHPEGLLPFEKIVPPGKFYFCFWEWLETDCDSCKNTRFRYSDDENLLQKRIVGAEIKVKYGRIANSASEGVQFVRDFRYLLTTFGIGDTFDSTWRFYDIE